MTKFYQEKTLQRLELSEIDQEFLNMLTDLFRIYNPSRYEYVIAPYVIAELIDLGFNVEEDEIGNIIATRGTTDKYPLLNAHLDMVSSIDTKTIIDKLGLIKKTEKKIITIDKSNNNTSCTDCDYLFDCTDALLVSNINLSYIEADEIMEKRNPCNRFTRLTRWNSKKNYTQSTITWSDYNEAETKYAKEILNYLNNNYAIYYNEYTGKISSNNLRPLGGDDKCGIGIALQVARELPDKPMKILFTVSEEIGCVGIHEFVKTNSDWLKDVEYAITLDRKGGTDLLMYACGGQNCTKNFASKVARQAIFSNILVTLNDGGVSDVLTLREHISDCINISVGYYEPHRNSEYVQFNEVIKIKEWVKNIIQYV